ncbi:hypothetical protein OHB49_13635 [Streptomyces sp. NBC_01717]|uniref:hypothetical protein n=1 Tax=Streptomyces sp. NBC_01717 TaxID=2975918 RepID=UPI002E2F2DE7|nr:hypothetical protein [Streptomyces sp. NBC_01717]
MTFLQLSTAATSNSAPDPFVLHGRPLRPGIDLAETSRFSDEVWRLRPALHMKGRRALILDFRRIPEPFRPTAKQLCYTMLSGPLPPGERRGAIDSIYVLLAELIRFFRWLDERPHPRCRSLSTLVGSDLLDYQHYLLAQFPESWTARQRARAKVRKLWHWRQCLDDPLSFDPWHVDGWGEQKGERRRENATDRIPEEVFGPLFVWATRFIDDFAADILGADQEWQRLRFSPPALSGKPDSEQDRAIRDMLQTYISSGRPLPGWNGGVNLLFLAQQIGCNRSLFDRRHRRRWLDSLLDETVSAVGVSTSASLDIYIQGTLDGSSWISEIVTDQRLWNSLAIVARHLQTAAYVITAFLSGMRDSEIKELRRGCLRVERDTDGKPYRWKVASLAFKGEDDSRGVPATWNVGERAARAIAVLEALQPASIDLLFTRLPHSCGSRRVRDEQALVASTTNTRLNEFVDWVNGYCHEHERGDAIPTVNSRTFRLQSSHFRRTLAWFIARRPGGSIAGALQYRHHCVQVFEGYAGTSDSGFRAEVESEQALARGEHLLTMIDAHEHTELAGPAADEAARRLENFGHRARFQGTVVTDERRLKRIMGRDDPAVYPGIYITCVHDHKKALCERARRGRAEGLPDHGLCQPLACRCVALTGDNVTAWRQEVDRIDSRLATRPAPPPLLQHRLNQRQAEIENFLNRHTGQPELT